MAERIQPKTAAESQIRAACARGTLSHALLLSGSRGPETALLAAAAYQCTAPGGERPCGVCRSCRKVLEGIHPDVTTVRDPEHKSLSVDVVRAVRADAYIRPNEGARKVYLFPDCDLLTPADQNVLLKLVEEGPPYAAFLFCVENPSAILPTLRSRCVELKLGETPEAAPLSPAAQALVRAMTAGKPGAVTEALIRLEQTRPARENVFALAEEVAGLTVQALARQAGAEASGGAAEAAILAKSLTKRQMIGTIDLLQSIRRERRYNGNVGQTLGALAVELEGIL